METEEKKQQDSWVFDMEMCLISDRREAIPRFIRKPRTCTVTEGQLAKFDCKIIAASPPIVTW